MICDWNKEYHPWKTWYDSWEHRDMEKILQKYSWDGFNMRPDYPYRYGTADGTFILPNVYKGERSIRQSSSRLGGINQQRPNEVTWSLWRTFLTTLCAPAIDPMYATCKYFMGVDKVREVGKRMRLRLPLGDWLTKANDSERLWPFYYSNKNNVLYRSYRKEWHK